MFKRIFLDANVLVDSIDDQRPLHRKSTAIIRFCLKQEIPLFTSCGIVTTVYYLSAKTDKKRALDEIAKINRFCEIIDFSNTEVTQMCELMATDTTFTDLEDTIQYILAKKVSCDCIISNDKEFYSPDIALMSSALFCDTLSLL